MDTSSFCGDPKIFTLFLSLCLSRNYIIVPFLAPWAIKSGKRHKNKHRKCDISKSYSIILLFLGGECLLRKAIALAY